jgi:hypothetical protein
MQKEYVVAFIGLAASATGVAAVKVAGEWLKARREKAAATEHERKMRGVRKAFAKGRQPPPPSGPQSWMGR